MSTQTLTIPPPPRPITPRASRRSWNERPVRVCFILFVLMAAATGFLAVTQFVSASASRRLVSHGEAVTATLAEIETSRVPNRMFDRKRLLNQTVLLDYKLGNGKEYRNVEGRITNDIGGSLKIGGPLEIKVDPADPRVWTDRTQPRSWLAEMSTPIMLLPLVVLLLAIMLVWRGRMLSLWKHGIETPAVVIDSKQSSIAPLSRVLRYVLADGSDKRVWHTLCPADVVPGEGETITLICAAKNPGRSIVAGLYV